MVNKKTISSVKQRSSDYFDTGVNVTGKTICYVKTISTFFNLD